MPLLWAGRKGPATYTHYFALGMHLSPALQSPFSLHLGCGYDARKTTTTKKTLGGKRQIDKSSSANPLRITRGQTTVGQDAQLPPSSVQLAVKSSTILAFPCIRLAMYEYSEALELADY